MPMVTATATSEQAIRAVINRVVPDLGMGFRLYIKGRAGKGGVGRCAVGAFVFGVVCLIRGDYGGFCGGSQVVSCEL